MVFPSQANVLCYGVCTQQQRKQKMKIQTKSLIRRHNDVTRQIHNLQYNKNGSIKTVLSFQQEQHQDRLRALRSTERELYNQIWR